jgi:hypothetical protein
MVIRFHRLSQTFGVRLSSGLPYIAVFGPKAWAWSNLPKADYLNIPLGYNWRLAIRR